MLLKVNRSVTKVTYQFDNIYHVTFVKWLDTELQKKGWNRSRLADEAGITSSAISHVYAGRRKPGLSMCEAIAKALNVPVQEVYRAAGLLPEDRTHSPRMSRIIHRLEELENLNPDRIKDFEIFLDVQERLQAGEAPNNATHRRRKDHPTRSET